MIYKKRNTPYIPRKPISRNAFALRHMILEEIKFCLFELGYTSNIEKQTKLRNLAQGLFIEVSETGYKIFLNGSFVLDVMKDDLNLYVRGDTAYFMEQQNKEDYLIDGFDQVLRQNNQQTKAIVEYLMEYQQNNQDY